jgi:hypothetical protein
MLDGEPLEKVAADLTLPVQSPAPLAAGAFRPAVSAEAFVTDPGEVGEVVTEPSGYTILEVVERIPSRIPPLDAVRARVVDDLKQQQAIALAAEKAEALRATLKAAADLDALATAEGVGVEEATNVTRMGAHVPSLGNLPELKTAAFGLTAEAPIAPAVYAVGSDVVIAVLAERVPPDAAQFDTDRPTLANRLQTEAENAAVQTFVEQLKAKSKIEYGQGFATAAAAS